MAQPDDDKKDKTLPDAETGEDSLGETLADTGPDQAEEPENKAEDSVAADLTDPDVAASEEGQEPADQTPPEDVSQDVAGETDSVDGSAGDDSLDAAEPAEPAVQATPEPTPTPPPAQPQVIRETVVQRKGGFFPMALGGLVAAALGYGAATYLPGQMSFLPPPPPNPFEDEMRGALDAQTESVDVLEAQIAAQAEAIAGIDLDALSAAVGTLDGRLVAVEDRLTGFDDALAGLESTVAAFDSRLTAAEKQPLASALSPEAIAAYERELEELRTTIAAQQEALANTITPEAIESIQAEIAALETALGGAVMPATTDALGAQIGAVSAQVAALEGQIAGVAEQAQTLKAEAEAQAARARSAAAMADITVAMQTGAPFAEAVAAVEANGITVPDPLKAVAESGVASQASLIEEFPPLAREALRVARASGDEGVDGSVAGFLRTQLGGRSVAPREGNDADAVLSRVEAAVRASDLPAAIAEIQALPPEVSAVLSDWVARVEAREAALGAADTLVSEENG